MARGTVDYWGGIQIGGVYDTTQLPVATDAQGNLFTLLKGHHNTTPTVVALDSGGNIFAVMKGDYDDVLKTIAVDSSGIMKANLSVQDLDFLTVRPAYGGAAIKQTQKSVPSGELTTIHTISGRGIVYGTMVEWYSTASRRDSQFVVYADGEAIAGDWASALNNLGFYAGADSPIVLIKYDDDNFQYVVGVKSGITFETSMAFKMLQNYGSDQTYACTTVYALVP